MAEISDLARAEGFELPAAAGLPEIHLRLVLRDHAEQAHRARCGFLGPQVPHLANKRSGGGEDLVVEAVPPPGIPEKR